jgi:hypothetical protein
MTNSVKGGKSYRPLTLTRARLFQAEMRSLRCEMCTLGELDTGSAHAKLTPLIIFKIKS